MTIQRKYSLPNCMLMVEGLSENLDGANSTDARPVLSILVHAECHLANAKQPLTGGRDFFESLVTAVSGYAQEFLSQVHHREAHNHYQPGLVQFQQLDNHRHRMTVHSHSEEQGLETNSSSLPTSTEIDLNTVQLFDLVEAVDQFFADSQTLPELSLQLAPVSKRYTRSGQQLVKQAVPATVGASSLALAAIAFFFVPIPEVQRPVEPKPKSSSVESTNGTTVPAITEPSQLVALNQKLSNQLNQAWKRTVNQDLIYRVGVAADGKIKGYTSVNAAANAQVQQTPLPNLLSKPTSGNATTQEPLAQFRVVFRGNGVQVTPWEVKQ